MVAFSIAIAPEMASKSSEAFGFVHRRLEVFGLEFVSVLLQKLLNAKLRLCAKRIVVRS